MTFRTIYFAMRIFGVSCVSTNRVPVQVSLPQLLLLCEVLTYLKLIFLLQTKLKSLAWLLLFRFGFMAYYSVRVLIKEMTQDSLQASLETKETSSEEVTENNEPEKRSPSCIANGRCVLCMDSLEKPTAAPCGHIFCWDCIIPMIVGSKQRSQSQDWSQEELERDSVKCPICRKAFQSGALLPLHCYS